MKNRTSVTGNIGCTTLHNTKKWKNGSYYSENKCIMFYFINYKKELYRRKYGL